MQAVNRGFGKLAVLVGALALYLAAGSRPAWAVGYAARACGFDLNHDGTLGDPVADCKICNGVTTFTDKELLYVDCQNGSDALGTGAPSKPFLTIQKAFNSANGPANGKADVVCFKGTCNETLIPSVSGVVGSYTRNGFTYPTNPAMLVGWDANNNGVYPPVDTADVAVLEGTGRAMAVDNNKPVSYFEMAHFTAQNYGLPGTPIPEGFMHVAQNQGTATNIYVHDLALKNIDRGQKQTSDTIVFNFFNGATQLSNIAIENLQVTDFGGFFVRGAAPLSSISGPYRFRNLSISAHGQTGDSATGFKLWGPVNGIEVSNSFLDANPAAWSPLSSGGVPTYAIAAAQCTRNWLVQGNTFIDWKNAFTIQPDAGTSYCTTRSMDNIVFDRNIVRNKYAPWIYGDHPIQIEPGTDANTTVENVTIQNNIMSSTTGWQMCIWSNAGNNTVVNKGTISILNNTCSTDINRWAGIVIGNPQGTNPPFPQQNYVIKNNVITGLATGEVNFNTAFAPTGLQADGNVFDPKGGFSWRNSCANCATATTLAAWRTQSGQDAHSKACAPTFVSSGNGDFHLQSADSCAKGAAVSATSLTTLDIDGDSRPGSGAWDTGADQLNGGPAAPQLLDVTPLG